MQVPEDKAGQTTTQNVQLLALTTSVLKSKWVIKVFLVSNKIYEDHLSTFPRLTQVTFPTGRFCWIFKHVLS